MRNDFNTTLASMPAEYQKDFIDFCKQRQYDTNGLEGGLIFPHHTPESWPEIDRFFNEVKVGNYVLDKLADMSAVACLDYMRFVSTNKVDDWDDKSALVDITQALRYPIWTFVSKHKLSICAFRNLPENMWPRISDFIEQHAQPGNTELLNSTIDSLIKISEEDWPEFNRFLDTHQIHEFQLIGNYAKMSSLQRNYLFDFIQTYQLKNNEISTFVKLPVEDWASFIALIEENKLTHVKQLSAIAHRTTEEWRDCADLIVKNNITDSWSLSSLEDISALRFYSLCMFVNEHNIDDEHVIYGLAHIPAHRWLSVYPLAQPLFAPPLPAEERGFVMHVLDKITQQEYRIDRVMPQYDDNERLARIAVVQDKIERGLMPQDPREYYHQMCEILETPINQRGNMHRAAIAGATAINVHAEGREVGTKHALQQLMALPYDRHQIDNDYAAVIAYLNNFPDDSTRTSAQLVLGLSSSRVDGFGPLSADTVITSYDLNITGKEFLARCWHYIQYGEFKNITDADILDRDRENARVGLIRNLADAYEYDAVVCNPGKLQHIAVGILQGRLERVHIDREIPVDVQNTSAEIATSAAVNASLVRNTVNSSLRYFIMQYEAAKSQAELKSHVDEWLKAERGLSGDAYQQYREDFRKGLDEYLGFSDLPEEIVVEMANNVHDNITLRVELEENLDPIREEEQQISEEEQVSKIEHNTVSDAALPLDEVQVGQQQEQGQLDTIHPLKSNYINLLNTLARNVEAGAKPRWTSGGSNSQKVQVLRALETFVSNQNETWILDAACQTKLLTLIKSICSTHRNWAPVHFCPPASLGEFLTLVGNAAEGYGTSAEAVNALEAVAFTSEQLKQSILTSDFNDLLDNMSVELQGKKENLLLTFTKTIVNECH